MPTALSEVRMYLRGQVKRDELLNLFADLVKKGRAEKGWSQEKLGHESGVATNTIFGIEHARPTFPKSRAKVAKALGFELP